MTISIRDDASLGAEASLTLDADLTSPRDLNRELWMPKQLGDSLLRALRDLVAEVNSVSEFRARLVEQYGIDLLDGAYAAAAAASVRTDLEAARFLQETRQLGGTIARDLRTSLDDIRDGPVKILAASSVRPTLALEMTSEWWDVTKSTQRVRLLRHLRRLTPGVDVQIIGSKLCQRRLVRRHGDDLPASVTERTQARLLTGSSDASTRTEQVRDRAHEALDELGIGHVDWQRLATFLEATGERRSYDDLQADVRVDLSREAIRQFVRRLRDYDLLDTVTINRDRHARLTRVGWAALDEHPDIDIDQTTDHPSPDGWSTDVHSGESESQEGSGESGGVSDPPNSCDSTVLSHTHGIAPGDRPADEAAVASAGGADAPSRDDVESEFLDLPEHHAAASAAPAEGIALSSRTLPDREDYRAGSWSYDHDRDQVVVRARASTLSALTMVRLCASLLSDKAFHQVLTPENLDGGPAETALRGLEVSNDYVLRNGACLGWLRRQDATGDAYQRRLEAARQELLAAAGDLDTKDVDEDHAREVLRDAHGLFGTACRIYDLLGIDVVVDLETPSFIATDEDGRRALSQTIAKATACASRYGVYSANRVLWEPRREKREQTLGTPNVDTPTGTMNPKWVLSGPDVELFRDDLEALDEHLELQEDGEHFAKFLLRCDVIDGDRREAAAEAVTRLLSFGDLEETRAAVSLLQTFLPTTFDVAQAVWLLNADEDNPREIDLVDVRSALSLYADYYDETRLLSGIGGPTVSKAIAALLDAEESLSTSELADIAGMSTQSIRNNEETFERLEALDLISISEGGCGQATEWRLKLPFRTERFDSEASEPQYTADGDGPRPASVLFDVLVSLSDDYGHDLGIDWGSDPAMDIFSGPTLTQNDVNRLIQLCSEIRPTVSLVLSLLDVDLRVAILPESRVELGANPTPMTTQTSLASATD